MFLMSLGLSMFIQGGAATVLCTVTALNAPVADADVIVNGQTFKTDAQGQARIAVAEGSIQVTVIKDGFAPVTTVVTVAAGQTQAVIVELQPQPTLEEHVTVSATRTGGRVEDQAMRVEVLGAEEIEEKQLMTPGDIVMMLNEMGGLRVQATSPSLGAASIRVQGMRGRYTLPVRRSAALRRRGWRAGPSADPADGSRSGRGDQGRASALYGAGALGGVIDLISDAQVPNRP
jgi:iron complex outermembrane receptor protein